MGITNAMLSVLKIQQELAKSRFKPYCEGGINATNAAGEEERINMIFKGKA